MPKGYRGALLISLLFASLRPAWADDPRAVLAQAIKAYGGAEKLAKLRSVQMKARGTVTTGTPTPFTQEMVWQGPDRLKIAVEMESRGQAVRVIETVRGAESWIVLDGKPGPLGGARLDELRAQAHVHRLLSLTPLLSDDSYEVSGLKEVEIDGRPASGVHVACLGERDVNLYFDKETKLLAKVERYVFDIEAKKVVRQEEFFRDYQDIDGLPTAKKRVQLRGSKKSLEMTITEVRYPPRIDPDEFADPRPFTRVGDVVYGHRSGMALIAEVFAPKKGANGLAVILVISGGWLSEPAMIDSYIFTTFIDGLLQRGYTVFAVCHSSMPSFTIPDAIVDVNRAVRFVRYHARRYGIDPKRIGITGGSAGGHLALMQGTAGDQGDPQSADAVERTSSRVQAVACFFPPTDFLNYGGTGKNAFAEDGVLANFRSALDVRALDSRTKRLERLTDKEKIEALCRRVSPITHVSSDDPPTLLIHGDADPLVPIEQSQRFLAKLKEVGVPAELIVKKGASHAWAGMDKDMDKAVDWFDRYLKKQ